MKTSEITANSDSKEENLPPLWVATLRDMPQQLSRTERSTLTWLGIPCFETEKEAIEATIQLRKVEEERLYRERRELEARLDEIETAEVQGVRGETHRGF